MFKYTRAAFSFVFDGCQKIAYWATVLGNSIYVAYLIFALCTGVGFWFVNVALLIVNVAYFIFFFVIEHKKKIAELTMQKSDNKEVKLASSRGNRLFSFFKVLIQFVNVGIIIYGIAFLGNDMPPLNIIFVTLMIIFLLLQVLFIASDQLIDNVKTLFTEAFNADIDELKKPAHDTSNWFKKLLGKEVEQEKDTKTKKKLDKFIKKKKDEKAQKKAAKKAFQAKEKQAAKEAKAAKKIAKKAAKKHTAPVGEPQEAQ